MDIALTLAARKFSPAQPFCNRYPRFRIHRSHEYDEEEFVTLFAHPFPTISAHLFLYESRFQLYFMRSPNLSQLKSGQSRFYTSPGEVPFFLESVFSSRISASCYGFVFCLLPVCSSHIVFKSNLKVKLSCHLHSFLTMLPSPETSKFLEYYKQTGKASVE